MFTGILIPFLGWRHFTLTKEDCAYYHIDVKCIGQKAKCFCAMWLGYCFDFSITWNRPKNAASKS